MTTVCQACGINPPAPDSRLCLDCQTDLRQLIGDIPLTLTSLQQVADRSVHINRQQGRSTRRAFTPLPFDEQAQTLVDQYKQWLQTTDSDITATRGLHGPDQWKWHWNNITADLSILLTLPRTPSRYTQLKSLTRKARRQLTPLDQLTFAGTCPTCGHPIYTPPRQQTATCTYCGNPVNTAANHALTLRQLRRMHITTTPAGAAQWVTRNTGIPITRKNIDNWQRRGKLTTRDVGDGYREYPVGQLIDLATRKQESKRQ